MTSRELFLANIRQEHTSRNPIWIMRQAGRYLKEYRDLRSKHTFSEVAKNPKLAAEVTLQPIERFNFDAAIIFSDILFILEGLGIDLEFNPGPKLGTHLESPEQIKQFKDYKANDFLGFVGDALQETRRQMGPDKALLGFCGSPFTVFCYLCGMQGAKDLHKPIQFLLNYPKESQLMLERLAHLSIDYLKMQFESGADAIQIFDTWAGELSEVEYLCWSYPYTEMIMQELKKDNHPVSLYIRGSFHLLNATANLDADIYSIDWKTPLDLAKTMLSPKTLQGNLNPYLLLGPQDTLATEVNAILETMKPYPGFIFNLGHGILPHTPLENVQLLVDMVKSFER